MDRETLGVIGRGFSVRRAIIGGRVVVEVDCFWDSVLLATKRLRMSAF
jgi:hypothetical protein